MKRIHVLTVAVISFMGMLVACDRNNFSLFGSPNQVQEGDNKATPTPTPSPSPRGGASPTPTPSDPTVDLTPCLPQPLPSVCLPGATTLGPILLAAQAEVPWAPEAIYVRNLVAKLNQDPRVCAIGGFPMPSDQIAIKYRSNSQSEDFDVVAANGEIIAIPAGPTTPAGPASLCTPARF